MLNLFAVDHLNNLSSSWLQIKLASDVSEQIKDIVRSSANKSGTKLFEMLGRSLIKYKNKRGPSVDP